MLHSESQTRTSREFDMQKERPTIVTDDPSDAVKQWFSMLSRYCASEDYNSTRAIFARDVASFGTKADIVVGLDQKEPTSGKASGQTSRTSKLTSTISFQEARKIPPGESPPGLQPVLTRTAVRSTVPAARRLCWNAETVFGFHCIPTSR